MKNYIFSTCILFLAILTACGSQPQSTEFVITPVSVVITKSVVEAPVATSVPASTQTPTRTAAVPPSKTPRPTNQPGIIVTFGETSSQDKPFSVFRPDGQVIALAGSRIRFWDIQTRQLIREITHSLLRNCSQRNATFSPDGHLFAVGLAGCEEGESTAGHVLVWDVASGVLLQEWETEFAKMPAGHSAWDDYVIPVFSLVFLPNSTTLIFASGKTLEIRDVFQKEPANVLKLGPKMFASQISISQDGRLAYIVMTYTKDHDWPSNWTQQQKLQVWNINTHSMLREIKYPEGWYTLRLELLGTSLAQIDFEKNTSQILDLKTDKTRELPYRLGWAYFNSDASLMIYAHLTQSDQDHQKIELWRTDTWRNIYTFTSTDIETSLIYGANRIIFSPDSTMLAIEHDSQVSLWDIRPVVQP